MKYLITRRKYGIVLVVLAIATATFWFVSTTSQPASARLGDGSVRFVSNSVLGMTAEQTARVCIGTTDPRGPILDWFVRFSDQSGTLLFQLPEQQSPAGEWRCSDIARSLLPIAGDAGTGRAQVAMEIVVRAPAGTKSAEIVGTADIIAATGKTETYYEIRLENTLITSFNTSASGR